MLGHADTSLYSRNAGAYVAQAAPQSRDDLIMAHLPKVKFIADRIAAKLPPSIERDDLYGAGVVGLLDAVERFDASRGVAFTTFAELRVRGAILDNLRSVDWASRNTRRRMREIQVAYQVLEQRHGRIVTEDEVAEHLAIPVSELRENLSDIRGLKLSNLDERDEETGLCIADLIPDQGSSPLDALGAKENKQQLLRAIDGLPTRERQVIALYYAEELTMKEIGDVLGVTESRVSQLRSQAIIRMKAALKDR